MSGAVSVDRGRVLGYRVAAQGLDRPGGPPPALALGIQDTPPGSARLALAARTPGPVDDGGLTLLWAARGAPHLHRPADLPALAAALWPVSDADATARITSTPVKEGARLGIAALRAAADALRAVVTGPMPKGEASAAVSARVPASLTLWCASCDAQHVSGAVFQQAGLFAGVRLEPGARPTTLAPIPGWPGVPDAAAGTPELLAAILRLLGPGTLADAARHLGTTPAALRPVWPGDLAEVRVDGAPAWLPADAVDALRAAPPPRLVRLLPPSDPYLAARDLLVPDRARRKAIWRPLASPGVVLVDGELAGTWRAKAARDALEVGVTPFAPLARATLDEVEREAAVAAAARGLPAARLSLGSG